MSVHRFRLDLLPFYARLIAILNPFMPSIGSTVLAALVQEYKRRYRKQHPVNLEHRIKNVRYIGELVKFRVCPSHIFFYCAHRLVKPETSQSIFGSQHVEVMCNLLEVCGRFIYKDVELGPKFVPLLEVFERKVRSSGSLDSRVVSAVQNSLLVVRPVARSLRSQPEKLRTSLEWFIRRTVFVDLN